MKMIRHMQIDTCRGLYLILITYTDGSKTYVCDERTFDVLKMECAKDEALEKYHCSLFFQKIPVKIMDIE
jgi:hypothetical protein